MNQDKLLELILSKALPRSISEVTYEPHNTEMCREDADDCSSGGPAGLVYGFVIAWFSTFSVYLVIAELASLSVPTHKSFDDRLLSQL